ncbi:MAG: O-acetyl-ADP-ribose deacetylase [Clostridia bacterium]|nr:O-acetyl-ADP-ribose deacetylase [Clostridia bacterium]
MPFEMVRNDITKMKVDAVVNAANRTLLGGGGVDGAIHRAAGPELLEECRTLGGCGTGEAKITGGYRLPARYVIHTVGPVWHGGANGEKELLAACYRHSLELASANGCESVAFPMISTGAYGYPKDEALSVAVDEITRFLLDHDMTVYLVVFGRESLMTGKKLFLDIREYIDDVYSETVIRRRRREDNARESLWQRDEKAALELDMEISQSIQENAVKDEALPRPIPDALAAPSCGIPNWKEMLKKTDEGFSRALLRLIDERKWTDAYCYKKANIDRKLFSKIRNNPDYQPSKPTVLAFAVALELSLPEAKKLLKTAGFSLTRSSQFDIILEYCISHRNYNVFEINEVLFEYDLPLLGSGMNV